MKQEERKTKMTPEQKAAFINAQCMIFQAEREIMVAENVERERQGYAPANGPEQWGSFLAKWESILGYNAVIAFFTH